MDASEWDAECVARRLSEEQRATFERDGFMLVHGALDAPAVERLHAAAMRADARFRSQPEIGPHHVLNEHDLFGRDDAYLTLIDLPTTFPKVWGVLGWHIHVFHTQLLVTPPSHPAAPTGAYGWHQDNNRMNLDLGTTPQPRISVKVGYFLTDLAEAGMGNLCVVPGSHLEDRPDLAPGEQPERGIEVVASAGDAIIFDRRLWHSASTNQAESTRVFVTVGYSHRWLRPKSQMDLDTTKAGSSPIRRQLLGATTSANAWFEPTDDDVPLRAWIGQHLGDSAVAE